MISDYWQLNSLPPYLGTTVPSEYPKKLLICFPDNLSVKVSNECRCTQSASSLQSL